MKTEKDTTNSHQGYYDTTCSFYSNRYKHFGEITLKPATALADFVGDQIFGGSMLALIPAMTAFIFPGTLLTIPTFIIECLGTGAISLAAPLVLLGAAVADNISPPPTELSLGVHTMK